VIELVPSIGGLLDLHDGVDGRKARAVSAVLAEWAVHHPARLIGEDWEKLVLWSWYDRKKLKD
jgi:hypothetical protein